MQSVATDNRAGGLLRAVFQDRAAQSQQMVFRPDQPVYDPSAPADCVFYVVRGQVRLLQCLPAGERLVDILGPTDWFGAVALAGTSRVGHQAITSAPSVLLKVDAKRFLDLLPRHPQAMREFSQSLARKLVLAHEEAAGLIFDDCGRRLLKALLRFSTSSAAQRTPEGVVLRVTHEQLAQAVGAARETVSLTLTRFRQQNLVHTGRSRLTFDPAALAEALRDLSVTSPATAETLELTPP